MPSTSPEATGSTDSSMLDRLRQLDPQAWQVMVRLYTPAAFRWCRQAGLSAEDAADVLQNVFQSVWQSIGRFRREKPSDSFRGWLWTITRNKIHDFFRLQEARGAGGTSAQVLIAQLPSEPSDSATDSSTDRSRMLHAVLDTLRGEFEDRTWVAFWRMVVHGHSAGEIAAELGMTTKSVRQAKYRVLKRCREEFEGLVDL